MKNNIVKIMVLMIALILFMTLTYASNELIAKVEQYKIIVNGEEKNFNMPIVTINDRTYIPLRDTAETLDMDVRWDDEKQEININNMIEEDELYVFYKNGLYGYIDKDFNIIIQPKYYYADDFSEGLALVRTSNSQNGQYRYINKKGEIVIPEAYSMAYSFHDGIALVDLGEAAITDDSLFTYIDKQGNRITDKEFGLASSFSEKYAVVLKEGYGFPVPPSMKVKNKWSYINTLGEYATEQVYEEARDFSNGYAAVKNNGKWGLINTKFKLVIDYIYDDIQSLNEGIMPVKLGNKWGCVDINNNVIVECKYDRIDSYSEGLACFLKNDKCGYLDTNGNEVISAEFENAGNFSEGIATVKIDGKCGCIDKKGEFVIQPKYFILGDCKNGLMEVYDESYLIKGYIDKEGKEVIL